MGVGPVEQAVDDPADDPGHGNGPDHGPSQADPVRQPAGENSHQGGKSTLDKSCHRKCCRAQFRRDRALHHRFFGPFAGPADQQRETERGRIEVSAWVQPQGFALYRREDLERLRERRAAEARMRRDG